VKPRPLPKTVAPLPDELLSGWLSRLAAANYCNDAELLAHIEIDTRHGAALDFDVEAAAVEKIANAARVDPDVVRSLTFPAMTPREASLTAQMPFQHCLQCSRDGLSLRHWRRAWAFDCKVCGTRLVQILGKTGNKQISEKLIYRARRGAGMLECAARSRGPKQLLRAMRAVTFAMSLKTFRGGPLAKAAIVSSSIDDYARVALLRAFEKEPRLLAAVDHIAQRRESSIGPMAVESHN